MPAHYRQGPTLMLDHTPAAAVTAGDVFCIGGQARIAHSDIAAGQLGSLSAPTGNAIYSVPKTADLVFLDGQEVYWDRSAEAAHFKKANDADFYLGTAHGDAAAAATTMDVRVNARPEYLVDVSRDAVTSTIVKTAGAPVLERLGGAYKLAFSATAEVQKIDILSRDGWDPDAKVIVEGAFIVVDKGDDAALDFNVGIANATHAGDADAIAESCFIHLDGNDLNVKAESDDGTTEVAATDTVQDAVVGTRIDFAFDVRDNTDIAVYIDYSQVLPDSTFKLNAAAGPLKLLAHLEKTANDTPGEIHLLFLRVRLAE